MCAPTNPASGLGSNSDNEKHWSVSKSRRSVAGNTDEVDNEEHQHFHPNPPTPPAHIFGLQLRTRTLHELVARELLLFLDTSNRPASLMCFKVTPISVDPAPRCVLRNGNTLRGDGTDNDEHPLEAKWSKTGVLRCGRSTDVETSPPSFTT
ncbi:unnamed protein product [Heligmosomoides polygyrus]|uniref:Uncharacterized protein n=1 Tax=Heligmosomoides polygyrus TaxID=6339 RepID=A0A183G0X6_HELPZ|nr:unnamed protein product [Heligmosomoides polygyrus]